jgi:hypothetical protein
MASALSALNTINDLAYLAGLFNWQMENASYISADGQQQVSFHVVSGLQAPIEQYLSGAINTFDLVAGTSKTDPNLRLFNTQLISGNLRESITRKFAINRIPFSNYDQLVDLGSGTQRIVFNFIFAGTMYQTAMRNFEQVIFSPNLGTLVHPFYDNIYNVLPVEFDNVYNFDSLNCITGQVVFQTSDLSHLSPALIKTDITSEIGKWFVGVEDSISAMAGAIQEGKGLIKQIGASI